MSFVYNDKTKTGIRIQERNSHVAALYISLKNGKVEKMIWVSKHWLDQFCAGYQVLSQDLLCLASGLLSREAYEKSNGKEREYYDVSLSYIKR